MEIYRLLIDRAEEEKFSENKILMNEYEEPVSPKRQKY